MRRPAGSRYRECGTPRAWRRHRCRCATCRAGYRRRCRFDELDRLASSGTTPERAARALGLAQSQDLYRFLHRYHRTNLWTRLVDNDPLLRPHPLDGIGAVLVRPAPGRATAQILAESAARRAARSAVAAAASTAA